VNGLTKISTWEGEGVSVISGGECFDEGSGICGLSRNYFLSEQPHESPHDGVESFRAGLKAARRDHPRRTI
jgi:hypothetical protein